MKKILSKSLTTSLIALVVPFLGIGQKVSVAYDLRPGNYDSHISYLTTFQDRLVFKSPKTGTAYGELFVFEPDSSWEALFHDGSSLNYAFNLTPSDSLLFCTNSTWDIFYSYDGDSVRFQAWDWNLTDVSYVTTFGPNLVFDAKGYGKGKEPYILDLVTKEISRIADIYSGGTGSRQINPVEGYVEFQGKLYFGADNDSTGVELYVYDGSEVACVADINETGSSNPSKLKVINDQLWFSAYTTDSTESLFRLGSSGLEEVVSGYRYTGKLYDVDGTICMAAGTEETGYEPHMLVGDSLVMLHDVHPNNGTTLVENSSSPVFFVGFRDKIIFPADDGTHGRELWVCDEAGCRLLGDINTSGASNPGSYSSNLGYYVYYGLDDEGELYFNANGNGGNELYKTDGESINKVAEINIIGDSGPDQFTELNGVLYFNATSNVYGRELHKLNCKADVKNIEMAACESFVSPYTGTTWSSSDVYTDYREMPCGGTQEINWDLTIINLPDSVEQMGGDLHVTGTFDSLQWIDEFGQPIVGANGMTFTPESSGMYAVIMENDVCVDTTAFTNLIITSMSYEVGDNAIQMEVYPNPVKDVMNVTFGQKLSGEYTVMNSMGVEIMSGTLKNEAQVSLLIPGHSGTYHVSVRDVNGLLLHSRAFVKMD